VSQINFQEKKPTKSLQQRKLELLSRGQIKQIDPSNVVHVHIDAFEDKTKIIKKNCGGSSFNF
jgi:hypothetical protein